MSNLRDCLAHRRLWEPSRRELITGAAALSTAATLPEYSEALTEGQRAVLFSGGQTVWRGNGQGMRIAVQGFGGLTNWSALTRSRHYSNASFRHFRVVLQTFYPEGTNPIIDTSYVTDYDFQVGFEYPYVNATSGIGARKTVTFSGANSVSYTAAGGPYGYIMSDVIDAGQMIPAGAFFGFWTTIEVHAHTGSNLIPNTITASNYLQKYVGYQTAASSQIASNAALTASSITAVGTNQSGYSGFYPPSMMLIEVPPKTKCVVTIGDSIAYGVGEGVAGSGSYGDTMGSAYNNAGFVSRGLYEGLEINEVNLARGSDKNNFLSTALNWQYRKKLLVLANPTHAINQNGHNDISATAYPASWAATTAYTQWTVVSKESGIYLAIQGGTSGSTGPSGTGQNIVDGTVVWAWIVANGANPIQDAALEFGYYVNVNAQIKALLPNVPLIGNAVTPNSSSTDSFVTTVNQTASTNWGSSTSVRGYFDGYVRNLNAFLNLRGYLDPSAVLEYTYPTQTSLWNVTGAASGYTYDGTHPNSYGASLAATNVLASLFT
jgi:lysophospholipase L1-like esterase